jgi:UDP-N-acetylglucosamine 3-dehydrogenase
MKIGIVGLGSIGGRHRTNASKLGHEVKGYDSLGSPDFKFERELYDWCDAAVIATPSSHHTAGLRACVERGKHCLIEKPISVGPGSIHDLLGVADEKKLVVMMGNNLRFHPCVRELKKSVSTALWASFICATTTAKPGILGDGVILNTGSHEVDLALYLFGPASVVAATQAYGMTADFVLHHEWSGMRSSFHLDFITPLEVRQFWVGKDGGNTLVDLPARSITTFFREGAISSWRHPGSYDDDYVVEMRSFVDRIEGKGALGATGRDGLATLELLLEIKKKALL